eukprot:CAMPEP_0172483832 /NCGR_PEP_ID=MMETSP1066-20121228/11012_1 /TAXON_ID=671091 /ORGANISM="Coscinodiscus wailesii, Strain CCMP2513" /LENGTH=82 /DNA_ID=CAMNT_0013247965 /DNA_START=164 /DNA_END=409 /DNA_ORIENTATION=+
MTVRRFTPSPVFSTVTGESSARKRDRIKQIFKGSSSKKGVSMDDKDVALTKAIIRAHQAKTGSPVELASIVTDFKTMDFDEF